MLFFIIQIIIIIYMIFCIYFIFDLKKYNINGIIHNLKQNELKNVNWDDLNPLIFDYNTHIDNKYLLENFSNLLIQDKKFKELLTDKNTIFFRNSEIIEKTKINDTFNFDTNMLKNYSFNINFINNQLLSVIKNNFVSSLENCKFNKNLINVLDGEITIYLFNPKHKNDILNKNLDIIKKYAHKYYLTKNNTIIIPPNWYYIISNNDNKNTILYHIDISNIFTFHYNYLR